MAAEETVTSVILVPIGIVDAWSLQIGTTPGTDELFGDDLEGLAHFVLGVALHQGYCMLPDGRFGIAVLNRDSEGDEPVCMAVDQPFKPSRAWLVPLDEEKALQMRQFSPAMLACDYLSHRWKQGRDELEGFSAARITLTLYADLAKGPWPLLLTEPPTIHTENDEDNDCTITSIIFRFIDGSILALSKDGPEVWEAMSDDEIKAVKAVHGPESTRSLKISPFSIPQGRPC